MFANTHSHYSLHVSYSYLMKLWTCTGNVKNNSNRLGHEHLRVQNLMCCSVLCHLKHFHPSVMYVLLYWLGRGMLCGFGFLCVCVCVWFCFVPII